MQPSPPLSVGDRRSRGCKLATSTLCNLRLPIVVPSPAGEPGRRDIKAKRNPRAQLPRTTGKRGAGVDFRPSVPSQSFRRQSQSQSQPQSQSQSRPPKSNQPTHQPGSSRATLTTTVTACHRASPVTPTSPPLSLSWRERNNRQRRSSSNLSKFNLAIELSCVVLLKSVLLISCVLWIYFQNAGSQLCFSIFFFNLTSLRTP